VDKIIKIIDNIKRDNIVIKNIYIFYAKMNIVEYLY